MNDVCIYCKFSFIFACQGCLSVTSLRSAILNNNIFFNRSRNWVYYLNSSNFPFTKNATYFHRFFRTFAYFLLDICFIFESVQTLDHRSIICFYRPLTHIRLGCLSAIRLSLSSIEIYLRAKMASRAHVFRIVRVTLEDLNKCRQGKLSATQQPVLIQFSVESIISAMSSVMSAP